MPLIIAIGILALVSATPQPPAAEFPDATATDPKILAIMQGSPPPPDKVVRFATGAGLQFPSTRWSFSHWRELQPTVNVWRGSGPVSRLPRTARNDIDALSFTTLDGRRMTWRESLAANYTDGIVVLHRGKIVYERYFGALEPQTPHVAGAIALLMILASLLGSSVLRGGIQTPIRAALTELESLFPFDLATALVAVGRDWADSRWQASNRASFKFPNASLTNSSRHGTARGFAHGADRFRARSDHGFTSLHLACGHRAWNVRCDQSGAAPIDRGKAA